MNSSQEQLHKDSRPYHFDPKNTPLYKPDKDPSLHKPSILPFMYITNKSQYSDFYNIHWSMKYKKSNQDNMHNHLWRISTFGMLKLSAGNMLICTNSNSQMSCILNNLTMCSGIIGICLLNLRSSLFHIKCILKKMCILCILQCSHGSSNIVTMT